MSELEKGEITPQAAETTTAETSVSETASDNVSATSDVSNTGQVQEKKKSSGCCIAAVIVISVIILLLGVAGFFGYRQLTKAMEQKDLGVTYTEQDYYDLMENIGLQVDESKLCVECSPLVYSDPQEVSLTATNAQASALTLKYMSFVSPQNPQVRFSDGMAEVSSVITFRGRTFPVYLSGTFGKETDTSVTGEVYQLNAGGLKLPANINSLVTAGLLQIANNKIAEAGENVRIDTLEITNEGVNFDGMVPTQAN